MCTDKVLEIWKVHHAILPHAFDSSHTLNWILNPSTQSPSFLRLYFLSLSLSLKPSLLFHCYHLLLLYRFLAQQNPLHHLHVTFQHCSLLLLLSAASPLVWFPRKRGRRRRETKIRFGNDTLLITLINHSCPIPGRCFLLPFSLLECFHVSLRTRGKVKTKILLLSFLQDFLNFLTDQTERRVYHPLYLPLVSFMKWSCIKVPKLAPPLYENTICLLPIFI